MRTNAVKADTMDLILRLLTPENSLACRVALKYGLRIGDVLNLRTWQIQQVSCTIKEEKTGKSRKLVWTKELREDLTAYAGKNYVFEHRTNRNKHRTRQAVYKDIKRAAIALRIDGVVGTHSMRKNYAVQKYNATGDIRTVRKILNHTDEAVTMLYALAAEVDQRKRKGEYNAR